MKIVLNSKKAGKRKMAKVDQDYLTMDNYVYSVFLIHPIQEITFSNIKFSLLKTYFALLRTFKFTFRVLDVYLHIDLLRFLLKKYQIDNSHSG